MVERRHQALQTSEVVGDDLRPRRLARVFDDALKVVERVGSRRPFLQVGVERELVVVQHRRVARDEVVGGLKDRVAEGLEVVLGGTACQLEVALADDGVGGELCHHSGTVEDRHGHVEQGGETGEDRRDPVVGDDLAKLGLHPLLHQPDGLHHVLVALHLSLRLLCLLHQGDDFIHAGFIELGYAELVSDGIAEVDIVERTAVDVADEGGCRFSDLLLHALTRTRQVHALGQSLEGRLTLGVPDAVNLGSEVTDLGRRQVGQSRVSTERVEQLLPPLTLVGERPVENLTPVQSSGDLGAELVDEVLQRVLVGVQQACGAVVQTTGFSLGVASILLDRTRLILHGADAVHGGSRALVHAQFAGGFDECVSAHGRLDVSFVEFTKGVLALRTHRLGQRRVGEPRSSLVNNALCEPLSGSRFVVAATCLSRIALHGADAVQDERCLLVNAGSDSTLDEHVQRQPIADVLFVEFTDRQHLLLPLCRRGGRVGEAVGHLVDGAGSERFGRRGLVGLTGLAFGFLLSRHSLRRRDLHRRQFVELLSIRLRYARTHHRTNEVSLGHGLLQVSLVEVTHGVGLRSLLDAGSRLQLRNQVPGLVNDSLGGACRLGGTYLATLGLKGSEVVLKLSLQSGHLRVKLLGAHGGILGLHSRGGQTHERRTLGPSPHLLAQTGQHAEAEHVVIDAPDTLLSFRVLAGETQLVDHVLEAKLRVHVLRGLLLCLGVSVESRRDGGLGAAQLRVNDARLGLALLLHHRLNGEQSGVAGVAGDAGTSSKGRRALGGSGLPLASQ